MVVVAIIGILATIALPAYESYVMRTKMSELVAGITPCRRAMQDMLNDKATYTLEKYQNFYSTENLNPFGCLNNLPSNPYVTGVDIWGHGEMYVYFNYQYASKLGGDLLRVRAIVSMDHDPQETDAKARTYLRQYDFFDQLPSVGWREKKYYSIVGWECGKFGSGRNITNREIAKIFCSHFHYDDE